MCSSDLEVKFRYGFESDLIKLVGSNELQFMIGSGEEVILGRAQGLPVIYAMSWYRKFPVVIFAPKGSGLDSPAKLIGHKIGIPGLFGASYVGWKALVYATQLDESKVSLQSIGFTQAAAVQSQQVDAALDYSVNGPVQMRLAGQEVDEIFVADYVDLPSNGIITNEETIAENPELVQAFVNALLHGLQDTLDNPEEAYTISQKYVEGLDDSRMAVLEASLPLWQAEQLGLTEPASWVQTQNILLEMGLLDAPITNLEAIYTNQFIQSSNR